MPDFKQTFQEEVRRLARKELKAFEAKINEQKKTINALTKRINDLEKKAAAPAAVKPAVENTPAVPGAEGRKVRFSPKSLTKFRKKFSLSQKALAILLGVTPFTVSHWEIGKNRPRAIQIEAFSALTKLGKRKLLALVAEKAPGELPAPKKAAPKAPKAPKKAVKKGPKKVAEKKAAAPAKRGRKAKAVKAAKAAAPAEAKKA